MDLRRPSAREWLVGLAGLALLVSLFLPWYGSACGGGGCRSLTGWQSLSAIDAILAALAAMGLAVLLAALTQRTAAVPIAAASLCTLGGIVAVILTLVRVAAVPGGPAAMGAGGRLVGVYLALASALALALSAELAIRDERPRGPQERPIPVRRLPSVPDAGAHSRPRGSAAGTEGGTG